MVSLFHPWRCGCIWWIVCILLSNWLGGGEVMLSRSGVAAVVGGTFGVTVMEGIVTLGNYGATLGGDTGIPMSS